MEVHACLASVIPARMIVARCARGFSSTMSLLSGNAFLLQASNDGSGILTADRISSIGMGRRTLMRSCPHCHPSPHVRFVPPHALRLPLPCIPTHAVDRSSIPIHRCGSLRGRGHVLQNLPEMAAATSRMFLKCVRTYSPRALATVFCQYCAPHDNPTAHASIRPRTPFAALQRAVSASDIPSSRSSYVLASGIWHLGMTRIAVLDVSVIAERVEPKRATVRRYFHPMPPTEGE